MRAPLVESSLTTSCADFGFFPARTRINIFNGMAKLSKALITFQNVFGHLQSVIIGAVHLQALPGSPDNSTNIHEIVDAACRDAEIYVSEGVDALIVENSHDLPYLKSADLGPETTAYVTRVCTDLRLKFPKIPIGVQVLAGGNTQALAVAQAANLNFVRVEGFVFGAVADEGYIDACAGPLLRYRKRIGAEDVLIFADVKKKHSSHSITQDLSVQDCAEAAEFFKADGVIITGKATGKPADPQEASVTQKLVELPVLFGSGVTRENLHAFVNNAHGLIVGSDFKRDGKWYNEVDAKRVRAFMQEVKKLRATIVEDQSTKKAATSNFIG